MRSHNQTLLTGPSVCKSLTDVRERESERREDEEADATRVFDAPIVSREMWNTNYPADSDRLSLSSPTVRREREFRG